MFTGSRESLTLCLSGITIAIVATSLLSILAPYTSEGSVKKAVNHELKAPPSTNRLSEKKWEKHTVLLPQGFHVQLAQASGRDTCILGYDDAGKIYVGVVFPSLAAKDYVVGASVPEEYVAAGAAIIGGKAYVLFREGIYFPDREPLIDSLNYRSNRYHPRDGYEPETPSIVCTWNEETAKWERVEGLPELIDRIYGNGNKDIILYCFNEEMRNKTFYAYRPGAGVRELYSATEALVNVTSSQDDTAPDVTFSFNGDKALYTVTVWPGRTEAFTEQEWPRWLGILTPESHWGLSIPLSSHLSMNGHETHVLALPGRNYVYVDGGLCEYSDNFLLLRRFRLPETMRAYTEQQHVTVMPIYGGLLAYETRSRRLNIMLNPDLVEN